MELRWNERNKAIAKGLQAQVESSALHTGTIWPKMYTESATALKLMESCRQTRVGTCCG